MAKINAAEINRIAEATQDAYSYDRYTRPGWVGAARKMAAAGYNAQQVEAVLRSKHMRWASDAAGRSGFTTAADFAKYWEGEFGGFNTPKAAQEVESLTGQKIPTQPEPTGADLAEFAEGEEIADMIDLAKMVMEMAGKNFSPSHPAAAKARNVMARINARKAAR